MPLRGELPIVAARPRIHASAVDRAWLGFCDMLADREFQFVAAFAIAGLLLTVNMVFWFPDLGQTIADFNVFP
jgi:hypothetical protein